MTINEAMSLQKAVRERVNSLKGLRDKVSTERTTTYPWDNSGKEKKEEVTVKYDVKAVDKKIMELELFLYKVDSKIKQTNAMTRIELEADVDKLLEPLQ